MITHPLGHLIDGRLRNVHGEHVSRAWSEQLGERPHGAAELEDAPERTLTADRSTTLRNFSRSSGLMSKPKGSPWSKK